MIDERPPSIVSEMPMNSVRASSGTSSTRRTPIQYIFFFNDTATTEIYTITGRIRSAPAMRTGTAP